LLQFAQTIRRIVLAAEIRQPLEFTGTRRGDQNFVSRCNPSPQLAQECLNLPVITRRRLDVYPAGLPVITLQRQFLQNQSLPALESPFPLLFRQHDGCAGNSSRRIGIGQQFLTRLPHLLRNLLGFVDDYEDPSLKIE